MELFKPITIGGVEVPNRLVLPPMAVNAGVEGYVTQKHINHYVMFAENGVGLIIVEGAAVDSRSKDLQAGLANYDDKFCFLLSELAESVKLRGSRVAIQLFHAGGCSTPKITGNIPLAPSRVGYPMFMHGRHTFTVEANELTLEQIKELVRMFGEAAGRAKDCGFDFVEVNGAHGWLISQFLSPNTNKRSDGYGGSFENRIRFAVEVVDSVRSVGIPIIFRMDGVFPSYGGISDEEIVRFAKELEKSVDCFHVSGSLAITPMIVPRGILLKGAEMVKKSTKLPVIGIGGISAKMAEDLVKSGRVDLVALGRALLADPEIPIKLKEGRVEDIRPCLRCNECIDTIFSLRQLTVKCAVNPAIGREFKVKPAEVKKRVVVVGAGPAGMEAARIAKIRGHEVILCEASSDLGGNLIAASAPKFKSDFKDYLEWLKQQVHKLGVEVRLNFEVDTGRLKEMKPDVVIVATGSKPDKPKIPGVEQAVTAVDVLLGKVEVGKKVVILGGGRVGCETALHVAEGRDVTILEVLPDILLDAERNYRLSLLRELRRAGVKWTCNFKVEKIEGNSIVGKLNGEIAKIQFETLIVAVGMKPRKVEFEVEAPCIFIGDCVQPRRIINAVHEAFFVACKI